MCMFVQKQYVTSNTLTYHLLGTRVGTEHIRRTGVNLARALGRVGQGGPGEIHTLFCGNLRFLLYRICCP